MSTKAKVYIGSVSLGGLVVFIAAGSHWISTDPGRFLAYLVVTAIASGFKVKLPRITGTLSVSYAFILLSAIQLSFSEVVAIAGFSAIVQLFWHSEQRPRPVHLIFNTSIMAMTAAACYCTLRCWPAHTSIVLELASASCAYFLSNTLSIAGVLAVTENKRFTTVWKTSYFWSFPYYLVGASLAACMNYLSRFLNWEVSLAVLPLVYIIHRSYGLYLRQLEEQTRHAEETASLHLRTIEALALAIEAKDQTTGDHLKRVQIYAREIGKDLGLSEQERLALQAASILHDVGKLAVPDYIITKPGKLTPEEFEKMKIHPVVGAEILERIDFPYPVVPIVRAHHEKWDGSGYPFGLTGEQIPIGARILSTVDCFDALASDRQYRKALPLDKAMEIVRSEAGKSFDPRVVDVLSRRYFELEQLSAADQSPALSKLSLDMKIERGLSPDAGFEKAQPANACGGGDQSTGHAMARAHQQAQDLYEFLRASSHSLDESELMAVICTRLNRIIPSDSIAIYRLEGGLLVPRFVWGENSKALSHLRVPLGEGVCGWVAENKKPLLNANPLVEPGYTDDKVSRPLHSALAVALNPASSSPGVLALYKAEKDGFSRDQLRALLMTEGKISAAMDRLTLEARGNSQRDQDAMTGLPSAAALYLHLESQIAHCRVAGRSLAVLAGDLDSFGDINDLYGRLRGDDVLQEIARGFRTQCCGNYFMARKGGDEFVLVLAGVGPDVLDITSLALQSVVRQVGGELGGTRLLSMTMAVVNYPADGDTADQLLAELDRRMQASKRTRDHVQPSDSSIDSLRHMRDLLDASKTLKEQPLATST